LTILQSLYLGIIQGLTEFLPISSTAHLILAPDLAPKFLGFTSHPPHAFDVVIQSGTLLAVLFYFRHDWARLFRGGIELLKERTVDDDLDRKMALLVILGCIPAGIAGLLLQKKVEPLADPQQHPASYLVMGIALIGVGLIMAWADRVSRKQRAIKNMSTGEALFVGVAQATALIPGVSRSGSTITAGLMMGLTREAAARFSFLLSAPIMLVATAWDGVKLMRGHLPGAEAIPISAVVVGILAAAIVGFLCIHFLLEYLRKRSLWAFVFYRVVLGVFLIMLYTHNR
jgi:undecaprenyl-diphosphatase